MTHTSTEQPEALDSLRQRLKFTHARHGHTERFVEAKESDVKAVIDLADSLHARVQELEAENAHLKDAAWTAIDALEASQAQRVPLNAKQRRAIFDDLYPHGALPQTWQNFSVIVDAVEKYRITQEKQG